MGVCLATSGPGATNLVTGIATAYMDSVPVVAITCNVANSSAGKGQFPGSRYYGRDHAHYKVQLHCEGCEPSGKGHPRAFTIARSGRPGPVLVDITKDVTAAVAEYEKQDRRRSLRQHANHHGKQDVERGCGDDTRSETPFISMWAAAQCMSGASEELMHLPIDWGRR